MEGAPPYEKPTLQKLIQDYQNKQVAINTRYEQIAQGEAAEAEAARRRREEARKAQLSTSNVSDRAAANTLKAAEQNIADTLTGKKKQIEVKVGGKKFKISDARAKHSVEGISQNDLVEFYASIKPSYYQYLNQLNGEGIIPGFMAQDLLQSKLGRTIVSEGPDGLLRVDTWKLLGALTATMKYLMERDNG